MKPVKEMVFYWIKVKSLQILLIYKMKSEMCSLATEQPKKAATVYRVSYRWGHMYFAYLLLLTMWLPSSKKNYFHGFNLSYVAVEAKAGLMVQFHSTYYLRKQTALWWCAPLLCQGCFSKKNMFRVFQRFKKIFWNLKCKDFRKNLSHYYSVNFYTSDFPFLCTGNDRVLLTLRRETVKETLPQ